MEAMLSLKTEDRLKFQLFEQWGSQGDMWYGEVAQLRNFSDNFQVKDTV
jgi:hypothetical protein